MGSPSTFAYIEIMDQLATDPYNLPKDMIDSLTKYTKGIFRSEEESKYSSPMVWIGLYIALASLICILAMVGDLLHGLRTRKLWFPCKYFTINAASLTVIAVAMKLPVDLTSSMPGKVDQVAKLGSMAFMCCMMANLLPSLATMCSQELFTNIVALVVLVITLAVNICIQIATGVVSNDEKDRIFEKIKPKLDHESFRISKYLNIIAATIYVILLLMLLIIHICSSLAILESKQIIKSKYQDNHPTGALKATTETLKKHVSKYWIIWGTGSPQFITVCYATTTASEVICVLSTILHIITVLVTRPALKSEYCESDYKWSMSVILVTQFIGVVVATIAPLSRCFAARLSFKWDINQIWNHIIKVFETESYWIKKLSDWKKTSIPIPFRYRKYKVVIENLKFTILNFLIDVQKAVVVTCKMISLIPFLFMMCVLYCLRCLNRCLKPLNVRWSRASDENTHQLDNYKELHEDLELHEKTLKSLLKSVNSLIQKAEKQQPNNLKKLLEKPSRFEGVEKYDNDLSTILSKEYQYCWSLPVVTLTAIVASLPNFQKDQKKADNFLESVSEAFMYVTLVEESLNATSGSDYVCVQKAAKRLWLEVEIFHKWLGHKLKDSASEVSNGKILRWFRDTAKDIFTEEGRKESGEEGSTESGGPDDDSIGRDTAKDIVTEEGRKESGEGSTESGGLDDDSIFRSICATSMYRITETIMLTYKDNIDKVSQADLIVQLSSMISDIVAACLTNLPKVIELKCYSNEIEKREANVYAAAQLLGETTQIIEVLEKFECPSLEKPDAFHFIDKWRAHLSNP